MNARWIRLRILHRKPSWIMAGVALIALMVTLASAWVVGGRLIQPAHRVVRFPDVLNGLDASSVNIPSASGAMLSGWWLEPPQSAGSLVLLHPIRGDRRAMLGRALLLYQAGYSCLLVDLQAHGESRGDAITLGYLERHDARAAVEHARQRAPDRPIGVIGWSLGGAAALLGSPLDVDAMVIESVYPTIEEAIENRLARRFGMAGELVAPLLLAQLEPRLQIAPNRLRPIDCVGRVDCPLLVMAGDRDLHTLWSETERLHQAASGPCQIQRFAGAAHEDLFRYDPPLYERTVLEFLLQSMNPVTP